MHAYKFRCESFSIRSRFLRYLLKILYKKNYNNNKYIEIKTLVLFTMIIRSSNINWINPQKKKGTKINIIPPSYQSIIALLNSIRSNEIKNNNRGIRILFFIFFVNNKRHDALFSRSFSRYIIRINQKKIWSAKKHEGSAPASVKNPTSLFTHRSLSFHAYPA